MSVLLPMARQGGLAAAQLVEFVAEGFLVVQPSHLTESFHAEVYQKAHDMVYGVGGTQQDGLEARKLSIGVNNIYPAISDLAQVSQDGVSARCPPALLWQRVRLVSFTQRAGADF